MNDRRSRPRLGEGYRMVVGQAPCRLGGRPGASVVVSGSILRSRCLVPEVTEGDGRGGSRTGTPRTQSSPRQRGGGADTPPTHWEVLLSLHSQHPHSRACHEVHTLGKSQSKRSGNREIWGLVMGTWPMAVASWVWKGSLGLSEPHPPQLQETLRRCRAHHGHGTTSILHGVGQGAAS